MIFLYDAVPDEDLDEDAKTASRKPSPNPEIPGKRAMTPRALPNNKRARIAK
jgi:hypothetical protein